MPELKKNQSHKKTREKNLRQLWLTLLIYYPGYEIITTQQKKSAKNNEAKDSIAKYQMMNLKKKINFQLSIALLKGNHEKITK